MVVQIKGLILAGGLGKRLRPLTHTGPKQLIPVANKPVVHYCIEDLVNVGIKDIGIIVGYTKKRIDSIKKAIGDGSQWGVKINYIEQDAPRGLAHAVWIARDFLGDDDFVVYLGDNILKGGIKHFVEKFENSSADVSLLLSEVKNPENFGIAMLNGSGDVIKVEEKPKHPKSNYAITGIYMFRPTIFKFIESLQPSHKGELELTHSIQKLIDARQYKVSSHFVKGWWDDAGTVEDILHANQMILSDIDGSENNGIAEEDVKMLGNVKIGEGSVIKKGSEIKGPVIIGKNCKIGPNVYIGPYTSIGDNTTIINGEIESSIIIGDCMINFDGKIIESLIGRHCNITSRKKSPKGYRLVVGENSHINL